MKKKTVRKSTKTVKAVRVARVPEKKSVLFLIKSWMFVVMFALMMGVGAIVGTYMSQQLDASTPQVAGAQTAR